MKRFDRRRLLRNVAGCVVAGVALSGGAVFGQSAVTSDPITTCLAVTGKKCDSPGQYCLRVQDQQRDLGCSGVNCNGDAYSKLFTGYAYDAVLHKCGWQNGKLVWLEVCRISESNFPRDCSIELKDCPAGCRMRFEAVPAARYITYSSNTCAANEDVEARALAESAAIDVAEISSLITVQELLDAPEADENAPKCGGTLNQF